MTCLKCRSQITLSVMYYFIFSLGCAPSPGAYDVKTSEAVKGPVSFQKSQRFKKQKGNGYESKILLT